MKVHAHSFLLQALPSDSGFSDLPMETSARVEKRELAIPRCTGALSVHRVAEVSVPVLYFT